MTKTGRCHCGAVSYAYDGPEKWMAHCHCASCRATTSSAFTSFFCVPDGHWQWTGTALKTYTSSPDVWRDFCGTCGAPIAYRAARYPDEIHFYAASLDDSGHFKPTAHGYTHEAVAWVTLGDGLKRK